VTLARPRDPWQIDRVELALSIDLGTSGPKVALVDARGAVAASAVRSVATRRIAPDGAEQDAEEIWTAIRDATAEVLARAGRARGDVVAVTLASQYFSLVPVDGRGRPVGPLVLWMDRRGAPYARAIYERHPDAFERWVDVHGIPPLPSGSDSLSHALWLKNDCPEVYARAAKLVEPVDYVAARLTGICTANPCSAFSLLLTDNRQADAIDWDEDLVAMSGLGRDKLPDLVPASSCIGPLASDVAAELGLAPETRVFAGINDTQAVAIGTATSRGDHGGVNLGTTSALVVHVPYKRSDLESEIVSMPSPIPGRYVAMAENGLGARTLDFFLREIVFARDTLGDHATADPFAGLEATVAGVPPGSGGLLFLPWLVGSSAPSSSTRARGGFLNLSLETTRAHLVRAILEGVAYNLRWLLPAVDRFAEREIPELRLAGGAALSPAWCQIVADVAARPVAQLEDPRHVINRATAFLAFERLGITGEGDLERFSAVRRWFAPEPAASEVYDRLFPQFLAAFERNRPIFEALNS
jgi:xylulokinase